MVDFKVGDILVYDHLEYLVVAIGAGILKDAVALKIISASTSHKHMIGETLKFQYYHFTPPTYNEVRYSELVRLIYG